MLTELILPSSLQSDRHITIRQCQTSATTRRYITSGLKARCSSKGYSNTTDTFQESVKGDKASMTRAKLDSVVAYHDIAPSCTCLAISSCHCCSRLAGMTIRVVLIGTASPSSASCLLRSSTGQDWGAGLDRISIRLCRVLPKPCTAFGSQALAWFAQLGTAGLLAKLYVNS